MAEPHRQKESRKHRHGGPPLSRHPLFPAIVALWFAALMGLGSLALSPSLIERAVLATGIDSAIPAAAPPLGMTARLLLAFALGTVGGVIGWALAWRLAHAHNAPAPKVFSVRDLDDERLPWPAAEEARSRAEPAGPILDPASLAAETPSDASASEPEPAPESSPESTAAQRIASASLHDLSPVELVERLAIALQHRRGQLDALADRLGSRDPDTRPETRDGRQDDLADRPVVSLPDFNDHRHPHLASASSAPPPQETEKALRTALAELQRMSGRV